VTLQVNSSEGFTDYLPSEPPLVRGYNQEVVLRSVTKNDKVHDFCKDVAIPIPPNQIAVIRVRISNRDYPGLEATGKLVLDHSQGTLIVHNVPIQIESWHE
jgi:hypothetical protein